MLTDPRGLALGIASGDAVAHYDEAVENCFQYRLKTGKRVKRALEAGGSSSRSLSCPTARVPSPTAPAFGRNTPRCSMPWAVPARRRPGGEAERMCLNRSFQGVY